MDTIVAAKLTGLNCLVNDSRHDWMLPTKNGFHQFSNITETFNQKLEKLSIINKILNDAR